MRLYYSRGHIHLLKEGKASGVYIGLSDKIAKLKTTKQY